MTSRSPFQPQLFRDSVIQICQLLLEMGKILNVLYILWDRIEVPSSLSESNILGCSSLGHRKGAGLSEPLPVPFPLISLRCRHTKVASSKKLFVQGTVLWLPLQAAKNIPSAHVNFPH